MPGNPYRSTDAGMGPLMRDIKNKICRDCELVALLEDDNGMEVCIVQALSQNRSQVHACFLHFENPFRLNVVCMNKRNRQGEVFQTLINCFSFLVSL